MISYRKKQNFIRIPCDPSLPQTLHSMKRNHIIGHHVTLTIHMVLIYMKMLVFGDLRRKKNSFSGHETAKKKELSVLFSSPLAIVFTERQGKGSVYEPATLDVKKKLNRKRRVDKKKNKVYFFF